MLLLKLTKGDVVCLIAVVIFAMAFYWFTEGTIPTNYRILIIMSIATTTGILGKRFSNLTDK